MSRYARKRDGNHSLIVKRFEALGCTVLDMSAIGIAGAPDLVVGFRQANHLVELKNPETRYGRAGLNEAQSAFNRHWNGAGMWTVCSEDEATAIVRNWAMAA